MLKSNWVSMHDAPQPYGCHVVRQKLGRVPARKSNKVHAFMDPAERASLAAKLEREWLGTLVSKKVDFLKG